LPDTYVPCELCHGKRYKPEILSIQRRGKNISQVLDMYVSDALELFQDVSFIAEELQLMKEIWLGYLKMGQPAHTLSWGESQRIKLVKHLLKSYKGHSVYFLDEPTVGLHPSDIEKLLLVLKKFLDKWDTILMIEHDKSLLTFADEVIVLRDGHIEEHRKK
jgi:excinuclease ABC subunit A